MRHSAATYLENVDGLTSTDIHIKSSEEMWDYGLIEFHVIDVNISVMTKQYPERISYT